ncbi:MAG: Rieske 2Fe-2S domain-containing protein [Acidimicrobiia bacterium]
MQVTYLGHAGLLVDTAGGSVVCDPWFNPAFHGSWFVFPRNDQLPAELMERIRTADYLYISHLHDDHLDRAFLRDHVDKTTTVLLPGFPTGELRRELEALGFTTFEATTSGTPVQLGDLEITICTETAIADGPGGDSAIVIADASGRLLNMNDCRPNDWAALLAGGPIDLHFLQFSGAIWYPIVYEEEPEVWDRLCRAKRESQLSRAVRYVRSIDARAVFPSAGPPAFLDPELSRFNDTDADPASIFPDALVFLDRLVSDGIDSGRFVVPGSTVTVDNRVDDRVAITHLADEAATLEPYRHKRAYLERYAADYAGWLDQMKSNWSPARPDLLDRLRDWWEPLLVSAPRTRVGIGAGALLRLTGDEPLDVYLDFPGAEVREWAGEPYKFRFTIDRRLVETVVDRHLIDWSNGLFLSCRFSAWRDGSYNEYLYNFFKSLSPERMARAEAQAAKDAKGSDDGDEIRCGGFIIERWCPHRQADLGAFGHVDGATLECAMHGWKFDLTTGACLTTPRWRKLRVRPA